jgi:ABC-type phosphate transport system substrate-binding protein
LVSVLQQFGLPGLLITLGLSVATLLARLYAGRRRLVWEEELNTKIGMEPFGLHDSTPDLSLFNSITVLVVKFRNAGWSTITEADYRTWPQVAVDGRFIVDFRVSEPSHRALGRDIRRGIENGGRVGDDHERTGWVVGPAGREQADAISAGITQAELRRTLPDCLYDADDGGLGPAERDQRRVLILPPLTIPPGEQFRLIICCRDDDPSNRMREYAVDGAVNNLLPTDRRIVERGRKRKVFTLTRALVAVIAALVAALAVAIAVPRNPAPFCGNGPITVAGSSAFVPVVTEASRPYTAACPATAVTGVVSTSREGIRRLLRPDTNRDATLALSDGVADDPTGQLQRQAIAVLIYAVVVNADAGVDRLTVGQIQAIMSGEVTSWAQLGGAAVPIRIVGRGPDSGSREAFERYVLQGNAEPRESSNNCLERDRVPADPVIRCERATTEEVLRQVAALPGAIGYADAEAAGSYPGLVNASIDGAVASRGSARNGYPFWTVEYAYTYGRPRPGGPLQRFLEHLSGDATARLIGEAGYEPCVLFDRSLDPLCVSDR